MITDRPTSPQRGIELPRLEPTVRVLLVVEGINDIDFLRLISRVLRSCDLRLPELESMERQGELVFLPFGGSHVVAWQQRLHPLGIPEFHLYDRELPPETDQRQETADAVNRRSQCCAVLTGKRSLENYLHPKAIAEAGGIDVSFGDFDPVATLTAKSLHEAGIEDTPWELLSRRCRSRLTHRAKRWLNTKVAERMTPELLTQCDPDNEVITWMKTIASLAAT